MHNDASATGGAEWADEGGQRVATCILYLNDVETGGRTVFDKAGVAVTPRAGHACVFYPSSGGPPDDATTHFSEPAVDEKFIVQTFERVARVPPPLGLAEEALALR